MDLVWVKVEGFRRFRESTTLNTNSKLIALLGPNEAGKSSLLKAILHLSHDNARMDEDAPRGEDTNFRIEAKFMLQPSESEKIGPSIGSDLVTKKQRMEKEPI